MTKDEYFAFHQDFCDRMVTITKQKNRDYAGDGVDPFANFRVVEKLGIATVEQGFLTRMSDKFIRISNLADGRNPAVSDESIADSLHDLSNYCALFAGYLRSKKKDTPETFTYGEVAAAFIQPARSLSWVADLANELRKTEATERYYEIVAKGRNSEIVIESCPDVELAVNRLDSIRNDWPTFQLSIREVGVNYEDDDGHSEAS